MDKLKVSIHMISYNHEKFIDDAIQGVLLQKTDFPFELIISDDCSTDNTPNIIKHYQERYPDIVKPVIRSKNLGSMANFIDTFKYCTGKYIALNEGDDYWTDPNKLQKQVDFMDANPDFAMCFHDVEILSEVSNMVKQFATPDNDVLTFKDLISQHYIPTCSLLVRKEFVPDPMPIWLQTSIVGDIPLELFIASNGKVKFFFEKMGVYRKHFGGITMDKNRSKKVRRGYIKLYHNLDAYFQFRYRYQFKRMILKHSIGMIKDRVVSIKRKFWG